MLHLSYIVMQPMEQFPSMREFEDVLSLLKSLGYEGVELNMTGWLLNNLSALESLLEKTQLRLPSFLSGEGYFDGLCLTSPDARIRERAVTRLLQCVEAAHRLRCLFVVGMLQGTARDEPDAEVAQQRIVEGLSVVAAAAERQNVRFVIEPVNHLQVGFNNSVAQVNEVIRKIGSRAIKPMVDTIHMNIEESSLTQPILDCGGELAHVHLCESNGGKFGTGRVDFAAVLDALDRIDYTGFASVKVYRHVGLEDAAKSSLSYLQAARSLSAVH
jgi:sugar phosphate isomerase/epimerase